MDKDFYDWSSANARRSMIMLAAAALLGLAIAGYGLFTAKGTRSRSVPPEAVALVNQRPILRSDFVTQAEVQYSKPFAELTLEQRVQTLEDMIAEELRMQRGLEIDLSSYDPDVRAALVAGVELEVAADTLARQPTDAELRAWYEANRSRYSSEGMLKLRDFIVTEDSNRNRAEALAAAKTAVAALRGGTPLASVILRYRLKDSGVFVNNGKADTEDIFEFAAAAKLKPWLYEALQPLNSGDISDPVEMDDGVHLLYVGDRRRAVAQGFEAAANQVWNDYKAAVQARVNRGNVQYLRRRADLLVAPDYAAAEAGAAAALAAKTAAVGGG
jgi:parvulin-like peptidyl-prolyl isomerase